MKYLFLFAIVLFGCIHGNAQKETIIKKTDTKQVNLKLTRLQSTVKQLEKSLTEVKRLMDEVKDQKDALSELNKEDMYWLQKLMEQKAQLEQMISNTMKASAEAQGNITKNLKAS